MLNTQAEVARHAIRVHSCREFSALTSCLEAAELVR
jgi:hypothetical protein